MITQNTRLNRTQKRLYYQFLKVFHGSWRYRSLSILSLLIGFYIGSNLTVYYLEGIGQRPLVTLAMVIIVESLTRLRMHIRSKPWPMLWLLLDNLRLGSVYAVVLEAFKLGS